MKKSIIAAGAASVALAAMPIVGVFAYDNVYDNITATLSSGCTITDGVQDKAVSLSMAPGNLATSTAAASISIICNNSTWGVTAIGSGATTGHATDLAQTKDASGAPIADPSVFIATNTNTSGSTSGWAFKVASLTGVESGNATIASGYETFAQIPTTADVIVEGHAGANITVNTQYQVFAATSQAGGTYTGQVTYTVVEDVTTP